MNTITKNDLPNITSTPVRFLYKRQDGTLLRLFWFSYIDDEFYLGSSLNPIISAGKIDIQNLLYDGDKSYAAKVDDTLLHNHYDSLKFSFHSSGVRHLKLKNKNTNEFEELYREKYSSLEDLKEPELLLAIISKRISLYQEYKKSPNQGKTSAVILDTPFEYLNYRQIFEFYVCKDITQKIPEFIIQKEYSFDYLTFKLKDNLFMYVKFTINAADNKLNQNYTDREIFCFRGDDILKTFSFK